MYTHFLPCLLRMGYSVYPQIISIWLLNLYFFTEILVYKHNGAKIYLRYTLIPGAPDEVIIRQKLLKSRQRHKVHETYPPPTPPPPPPFFHLTPSVFLPLFVPFTHPSFSLQVPSNSSPLPLSPTYTGNNHYFAQCPTFHQSET